MTWIATLRRYLLLLSAGNLLWEFAHMPLYRLWHEGTLTQIVLYGLHCTGGDILIGLASVMLALLLFGRAEWPAQGYRRVAFWTLLFGLVTTIFSEWYNVRVEQSWSYSGRMPTVFGVGLSPLTQWLAVPALSFWWARRDRG